MAKRKPKPKTKMIWELEPGDFGRLRDKNRTLVFATHPLANMGPEIIAIDIRAIYEHSLHFAGNHKHGKFGKLEGFDSPLVDLLDITLE